MMSPLKAGRRTMSFVIVAGAVLGSAASMAQAPDERGYFVGDERRLQIVVHILGEVSKPGEYVVGDDTSVLELVSKAGGATEYGNLGAVTIKRRGARAPGFMDESDASVGGIVRVDISEFLSRNDAAPLPVLQPNDVVVVPRNRMSKWRTGFTLVRDVAVVATTYLLYLRATQ